MQRKQQRVAFGRINRRGHTLDLRPFAEDMQRLAESRRTETVIQGRRWIASDMTMTDDGSTMTGVLGFELTDQVRAFDEENYSWLKGTTYYVEAAQRETVVPFAVDLRDKRRWVAFATSGRIRHAAFSQGMTHVINAAVQAINLLPAHWEVDMVTSRGDVLAWVAQHPGIRQFRRVVRFPNPGRDLDEVRRDMNALGAAVKDEQWNAPPGQELRLRNNAEFEAKLEGLERGNIDIYLVAEYNGHPSRYTSRDRPDEDHVDSFHDLRDGVELVREALAAYSERQATSLGLV